ncbi:permease [Gemmatirosa kalamazoonensis]|uniref:Permease n=1 Tax=Gemmatirosa kalamazoonensis TaxID=861299 RepID=W0RI16_9BACT|nr:ABC transporter permease [Gemmatirosa kalamazoonensis]AHG90072.1 permease [Gemmatirosa kalamazoonensis]
MSLASWSYRLRRRLHRVVTPQAHAEELNDELKFHLEMEIDHNVRSGLSPEAARAKALRELGAHGEWRGRAPGSATNDDAPPRTAALESLVRDVRQSARALLRAPAFSVVAVLTIALGIGVTTAVYSAVDGVLLRPLPYPAPDRLVRLYEHTRGSDHVAFAGANALDVQREARTLQQAAYVAGFESTVLGADEPLRVRVAAVSREFFDVFRVPAARGRLVGAGEGVLHGPQVAIVSDRFWRESLGGDVAFSRRALRIEGELIPVVGVMPPSFNFPARTDVWYTTADDTPSRTAHNWAMVARLAPGASAGDAQREVSAILGRLKAQLGKEMDAERARVVGLHEDLAHDVRRTLLILLGAVGLVLLVACVNLASANLARGETRQREYAVRTAMGARPGRIVRQVLTENILLAAAGGALGCALAWGLTRALVALAGAALPRFAIVAVDGRVLAFAAAASVVTGILVSLAPALRITGDLRGAIGAGGRAGIQGARLRARGLLIGAEVAMAVALLVGAGLLAKSLRALLSEDPGFHTEGVLTADIALPSALYADTARVASFFDRLLPTLRAVPGVTSVGVINAIPMGDGGGNSAFAIDGATEFAGSTDYRVTDSTYFRTLGIPLVRGRGFQPGDRPGAEHVALVNQAMARKYWPGASPLGHRIRFPGMDRHPNLWLTIVGVVGDVRSESLDEPPVPTAYVYYGQRPERLGWESTVVVRTSSLTPALGTTVRERVRALDPNVPVRLGTLAGVVGGTVESRRFTTTVLTTFAALALLLAAVGIHGVLAYLVAQRHREIGVRMALGAARGAVRGMVLRDAMAAVVPGILIGVAGALALSRVLRGMLYGVSATDPAVFTAVAVLLGAVALAAAWIPAARATRVDPLEAIRAD